MTTYVYETIPSKPGEKSEYFEIRQSMNDVPLTIHPETGVPIRRVILGGFGVLKSTPGESGSGGSDTCGPGCCCG